MDFSWFKSIIGKFSFSFNRTNSPNIKQAINVKSNKIIINQRGTSYSEIREIVTDIVEQKIQSLYWDAEEIYKKRVSEFKEELLNELKDLKEEELNRLRNPDAQYALIEATKIGGRKKSKELRKFLSKLVIGRIKNNESENSELKNIVYNEAIKTIEVLTIDQIKILTLVFILRYSINNEIRDLETFEYYLKKRVKPFIGFKYSNATIQHLEYASCVNIQGGASLINIFKDNYLFLFMKEFTKDETDYLALDQNLFNKLFIYDELIKKYKFIFRNKKELESYLLDNNITKKIKGNKIHNFYLSKIKSDEEIKNVIESNILFGKELLNKWDNIILNRLTLTSVGIIIAITYSEQVTGSKINENQWIK